MKLCRACDEIKPETEFHKNRTTKDGLQNRCKPCHLEAKRQARHKKPEHYAAYNREWNRKQTEKHGPASRHISQEQRHAHYAIVREMRRGTLTRPTVCDYCGREGPTQAHHEDYAKPLDVRWLCARCHRGIHAGVIVLTQEEAK